MQSSLIDTSYFVKVEYINVTDSNKPYPYLLTGCPDVLCPLEIFTASFKPRFPASADVECSKVSPPTPPGNRKKTIDRLAHFFIDLLGDGGNKKLTVILTIVGIFLGIVIVAIFAWLYLRRADRDSPLLSSDAYTPVA